MIKLRSTRSFFGTTMLFLASCFCSCSYLSKKPTNYLKKMDSYLLQEITHVLSKSFGTSIQIKSVDQLSEPDRRNLVLRIGLQNITNQVPTSIILKQSLRRKSTDDEKDAFSRFARDWAGLEFLNKLKTEQSIAPKFYGGSKKHRFILFEDFGEKHVSLVDSLMGDNPTAAQASLTRFMKCLGKFHAAGYGHAPDYLKILTGINPEIERWHDETKRLLTEMHTNVDATLNALGLQSSAAIHEEIEMVIRSVSEPGDFTTYIHGDICPDNTFDYPEKDEFRLIDFECGRVGHALVDATYLRMGMPTCWCAGKIPDELIDSLELLYRKELMKTVPVARDDKKYFNAYVNACAFWGLENISNGYTEGKVPREARVASRIQAFINVAEKYDNFPHLRSMATQVLDKLKARWAGTKQLDFFPAFTRGQT